MDVLCVQEIEKVYGEGENAVRALNKVSFSVEQGEFLAIVGTSGSGKSSLLNLLGGLDHPTGGRIRIRGRDIAELDRKSLTIFRRRNIGFVFQNYSLMPVLNVYDNVVLPVTFDRGKHVDHKYIEELLRELGLWENSSRGRHWQGRWRTSLRSFSPTSLRGIWTPGRRWRSWGC